MDVAEILEGLPHLTPAQVFEALSYYFDHKRFMDADLERSAEAGAAGRVSETPEVRAEGDAGTRGGGERTVAGLYLSRCAEIPRVPGIYRVVVPHGLKPTFLQRGSAGRFQDRDPNVPIDVLEARWWVPETGEIYVGRARQSLRRRVWQMLRFGRGHAAPHWGGRLIWQLAETDDLIVAWRAVDDPVAEERRILSDLRARYGRLPFANLQS